MKKFQLLFFLLLLFVQAGFAQFQRTPEQESIVAELNKKTQLDYQQMLDLLDIKSIRARSKRQ